MEMLAEDQRSGPGVDTSRQRQTGAEHGLADGDGGVRSSVQAAPQEPQPR